MTRGRLRTGWISPDHSGFLHPDNAYGKTLRQYHGWVVRGVFAVGISISQQGFCPPTFGELPPPPHLPGVFPAGTESSSVLSKLQRRPGVEGGRRAEGGLHQRDAPGPGDVPARHGEAAGHPGWPVRGVQPGVGRSGVKTEAPTGVSLPGMSMRPRGAEQWLDAARRRRGHLVYKRMWACPAPLPGVSSGCWKPMPFWKRTFGPRLKALNDAAKRGGYNYYNAN